MDNFWDREKKNEADQGFVQLDGSWNCPVCTFANDEKANVCAMCGYEREN